MAGVYNDILVRIAKDMERAVGAYEKHRQRGRLDEILKVVTIVASLVVALGFFVQFRSIKDPLEKFLEGDVPNVQNRALGIDRFGAPIASTYRQDLGGNVHRPLNVLDGDPSTGWAECKGGEPTHDATARAIPGTCTGGSGVNSGRGEWIELPLTNGVDLKTIRVRNGFQGNNELFLRNPRVKELEIALRDGSGESFPPQEVTLLDEFGFQTFALIDNGQNVSTIRLTILSSYPGESYRGKEPFTDTTISDVELIPELVG